MTQLEHYLSGFNQPYSVFNKSIAVSHYKPRNPLSHKGDFGHALIIAGSYGKIGAALLAAKACLNSGAGLLTVFLPSCGYSIIQTALPEAMVVSDNHKQFLSSLPTNINSYQAVGIGPGIGKHDETKKMLEQFLKSYKNNLVLDADALNIISEQAELWDLINPNSIITPHPKEFDRLFGQSQKEFDRFEKAQSMAIRHRIIIVLKGHFTAIFKPDGQISFNTSGNAGMAKGGSGDALTGIITALLAQSYEPEIAACLGVYLHGFAGDLASIKFSEEAMLASDLISCIGKSFLGWKSAVQRK